MVSFHWRNTTQAIDNNEWDYSNNLDRLFKIDQWARVFDVDNVIDILVISYTGNFYSISPRTFAERMPRDDETVSNFYVPPNNGKAVTGYPRNGNEDDHKSPMGGPSQKGEEMVRFIDDGQWAAWNGDKEKNKYREFLKDIGEFNQEQNRWSAFYEEIKYQETLRDKDQRDASSIENLSDGWWRYNQLSRLINFITAFQEAVRRGYKFFNPNLQSRINYIKKVWSNENHMLVMYLDAKSAALTWGCFNPDRDDILSNTFLSNIFQSDKLSNRDAMLNMGATHCTKPMPSYAVWGRGRYGMGSDLFSPNTKYRALLQPDGNFVVYDINKGNPINEWAAVWASGTYLKRYRLRSRNKDYEVGLTKPTLVVQDDGNVVIYSRDGTPVWAIGTTGDIRLGLDNDGVLFAFRNNDPNDTVWSSIGGNNHRSGEWSSLAKALITKSCKVGDPRNPMSGFDISKQILDICKTGNHMVENDALCGYLSKKTLDQRMDNPMRDIKRDADKFVKDVLCAPDRLANANDKTKRFCSCFVPYSDVQKKLVANGIATNCTDTCMMDGYRSADQPEACDSKICILDQSIKNLLDGKYISQQCNIGNSTPPAPPAPPAPSAPAAPSAPSAPAAPSAPSAPAAPAAPPAPAAPSAPVVPQFENSSNSVTISRTSTSSSSSNVPQQIPKDTSNVSPQIVSAPNNDPSSAINVIVLVVIFIAFIYIAKVYTFPTRMPSLYSSQLPQYAQQIPPQYGPPMQPSSYPPMPSQYGQAM